MSCRLGTAVHKTGLDPKYSIRVGATVRLLGRVRQAA